MNSTTVTRSLLASAAVLMLLGTNAAFASTSQPLSFTVGSTPTSLGTVLNLGDQTYTISGGNVVFASIAGQVLDPNAVLTFSLDAQIKDVTAKGTGTFNIQGTSSGQPVSASAKFGISSAATLAQVLTGPSGVCRGNGAKACSELPVIFGGLGIVEEQSGTNVATISTIVQLENPYFNPFGAPIVLATADGSVQIVTTYNVGQIKWSGSVISGPLSGTLGTTPVSGILSLTSSETEDLVAGTAVDSGSIQFSSMTNGYLNEHGTYSGTSTIPPTTTPIDSFGGPTDCSAALGLPPGTCTETGFNSVGQYSMADGLGHSITGMYVTGWTTPALAFSSAGTATFTQQ